MPSETVKQRAIEALQNLPENATIDDAIELAAEISVHRLTTALCRRI